MAQTEGCVLSWDLVEEREKPESIRPQVLVRSDYPCKEITGKCATLSSCIGMRMMQADLTRR